MRLGAPLPRIRFNPHDAPSHAACRPRGNRPRPPLTFGVTEVLDGVNVVLLAVGLFAVGETLYLA